MTLNTLRLQRLVQLGLIVSIFFASLLAAVFFYFYFSPLDREAGLLEKAQGIAKVPAAVSAVGDAETADRMEKKRSLPAVLPEDVPDVFDRTRVPGRE